MLRNKSLPLAALAALFTAPGLALAQATGGGGGGAIDTSAAVTAIAGITAAVAAVGIAKFAPAAVAVAYKWVKAAIFG